MRDQGNDRDQPIRDLIIIGNWVVLIWDSKSAAAGFQRYLNFSNEF